MERWSDDGSWIRNDSKLQERGRGAAPGEGNVPQSVRERVKAFSAEREDNNADPSESDTSVSKLVAEYSETDNVARPNHDNPGLVAPLRSQIEKRQSAIQDRDNLTRTLESPEYKDRPEMLDLNSVVDVVLDETEDSYVDGVTTAQLEARPKSWRKMSTVGAGLHKYSFATSRHVAENLNQTYLRLNFAAPDNAALPQLRSTRTNTLRNMVAQFEHRTTPMYYTLQALLSSIHRSESVPLVVEIPRIEHPYEGLTNETCFLALVLNKVKKYESALFFINPGEEGVSKLSLRFVIPLWGDMGATTSGDGNLFISSQTNEEEFELELPSLQSMWTTMNALNNFTRLAKEHRVLQNRGRTHKWLEFYDQYLEDRGTFAGDHVNESGAPVKIPSKFMSRHEIEADKTQGSFLTALADEEQEARIVQAMRDILGAFKDDLDNVTFKDVYTELAAVFGMDMKQMYKPLIDEKLLMVVGQMEEASEIVDGFLYLGTEWNASHKEELESKGCKYILNMSTEIGIFFPEDFNYMRREIRDNPDEDLLSHLDPAVDFITEARLVGSSILVHCQMGVSRSASVVIAYLMKTYGLTLENAYVYAKARRNVIKPNPGFWEQLEKYEHILQKQARSILELPV